MRVLFRVEANSDNGLGHSMRCLSLAQQILEQGHVCHLATANSDDDLLSHWYEEALNTGNLYISRNEGGNIAVGSVDDADLTLAMAHELSADWIVLDNYNFEHKFQEKLASSDFYLLYLDDFLKEYKGADLVLNQNCQINPLKRNNYIAGTDYFLAGRKLIRLIKQRNPAGLDSGDILVTFGGSDPGNLGLEVAEKLLSIIPENKRVRLAFASNQAELERTKKYAASFDGRLVIHNRTLLVDIYPEIRFAICAGGVTTLELASLGIVPAILVLADNQAGGVSCLDYRGAAKQCNSISDASEYIVRLLHDSESARRMSQAGMKLVDGKGAGRVYGRMKEIMST